MLYTLHHVTKHTPSVCMRVYDEGSRCALLQELSFTIMANRNCHAGNIQSLYILSVPIQLREITCTASRCDRYLLWLITNSVMQTVLLHQNSHSARLGGSDSAVWNGLAYVALVISKYQSHAV